MENMAGNIIQIFAWLIGNFILSALAEKYKDVHVLKFLYRTIIVVVALVLGIVLIENVNKTNLNPLSDQKTISDVVGEGWKQVSCKITRALGVDDPNCPYCHPIVDPEIPDPELLTIPENIPELTRRKIEKIDEATSGIKQSRMRYVQLRKEAESRYDKACEELLRTQSQFAAFNGALDLETFIYENHTYTREEVKKTTHLLEAAEKEWSVRKEQAEKAKMEFIISEAECTAEITKLINKRNEVISKHLLEDRLDVDELIGSLNLDQIFEGVTSVEELFKNRNRAVKTESGVSDPLHAGGETSDVAGKASAEPKGKDMTSSTSDAEQNYFLQSVKRVQKVFTIEMPPEVVDDPDESETPDFKL
ncbi:MAG: hypothetical protein IJU03_13050 [Thermoguttaceae bacterium]|nr:hypothetical protein [Thermoguttaceae bacterium]